MKGHRSQSEVSYLTSIWLENISVEMLLSSTLISYAKWVNPFLTVQMKKLCWPLTQLTPSLPPMQIKLYTYNKEIAIRKMGIESDIWSHVAIVEYRKRVKMLITYILCTYTDYYMYILCKIEGCYWFKSYDMNFFKYLIMIFLNLIWIPDA